MLAAQSVAEWTELRSALAQQSPWLTEIDNCKIDLRKESTRSEFEPQLIEQLAGDIATLLDRVLGFRKEARDLDLAAVKAAVDYKRFLDLQKLEAEIENESLNIETYRTLVNGHLKVAHVFSEASEPLAAGLAGDADVKSVSASTLLRSAENRKRLQDQRRKIIADYERSYHARHVAPGNAHNFHERYRRVMVLLNEDLSEAYEKCTAMIAGIRIIYGREFSLPSPLSINFIDEFVLISRSIARYLDLEGQNDVVYDLVIPLAQPFLDNGRPLVPMEEFNDAVDKSKPIQFDLTPVFESRKRVRLRGIGLSFGNFVELGNRATGAPFDPGRLARLSTFRLRAEILPAPQQDPYENDKTYRRPAITLGDVGVFGGSAPLSFSQGDNVWNLNPSGPWSIRISPNAVYSTHQLASVTSSEKRKLIYDLKLHLRIIDWAPP